MWIFGQVWLYSLGAFVLGVLLTWLLLLRPVRKQNRELERQLTRERTNKAEPASIQRSAMTRPGTPAAVSAASRTTTIGADVPEREERSDELDDEFDWADDRRGDYQDGYSSSYDSYDEPYRAAALGSPSDGSYEPPSYGTYEPQPYESPAYDDPPRYDEQPAADPPADDFALPKATSDATNLFLGEGGQQEERPRDYFEAASADSWRQDVLGGAPEPEPAPDGDRAEADQAYLAYLDETRGQGEAESRGELRLSENPAERTTVLPPTEPPAQEPSDPEPEQPVNFFQPAHAFRPSENTLADQQPDTSFGRPAAEPESTTFLPPAEPQAPEPTRTMFQPPPPGGQVPPAPPQQAAPQQAPPQQAAPQQAPPQQAAVPPGPFGPSSALPRPDGSAPAQEFQVKARTSSMVFHTSSSPFFERLLPQVWFRTPEDAMRAGFTSWQRPEGTWGN